jgi:hypothetical protein
VRIEAGRPSRPIGWLLNRGQFDFLLGGKVLEVGVGHKRVWGQSVTVSDTPGTDADCLCDIRKLPFKDLEFDLCIAHEVFCTHPRATQLAMLREIARVSRTFYVRQWRFCAWRLRGCGFKLDESDVAEIVRERSKMTRAADAP